MDIIFKFADLEVTDLSQIDTVYEDASPEAKASIDRTIDVLTSWHAEIITENIKKLPQDEKEKIIRAIKEMRKQL